MRFIRLMGILFALSLLLLTLLRMAQPASSSGRYIAVYGQRQGDPCCSTLYLVNPRDTSVNRVYFGTSQDYESPLNLSPSGDWRASYEATQRGLTLRFIPMREGLPVITAGTHAGYIWHMRWSSQQDRLFYISRGFATESALFTAAPDDPNPRLLSHDFFSYVRSMSEQVLPYTHFSPYLLLLWGGLLLGVMLGLPRLWRGGA